MITAVLLYCGPVPSLPDLCLYKCLKFSLHCTISSVVFQNMMITAVLLYCGSVFPPSTHVCTSFSVHGTISSVVCQNMMITAVLWTCFSPVDLCLYKFYCTRYNIICCVSKHDDNCCTVDPFLPSPDFCLFLFSSHSFWTSMDVPAGVT